MQSLRLAVENPASPGEYRVFNQFDASYSVNELADRVARIATDLGLHPTIEHPPDPRVEAEQHYYNPIHEHLPALGYRRTRELDEVVREIFHDLLRYRRRLEARKHVLAATVQWRVPDSRGLLETRNAPGTPTASPAPVGPTGSPSAHSTGLQGRSAMHAVVTLAGEGTRMLPWSRGLRKEFLPLYDRVEHRRTRPEAGRPPGRRGARGRGRRAHHDRRPAPGRRVRPELLQRRPRLPPPPPSHPGPPHRDPAILSDPRPGPVQLRLPASRAAGFGDAVLQSEGVVGRNPFFLHAGDGIVLEPHRGAALRAMGQIREKEDLDAVLLVRKVADPRRYGVIEGVPDGKTGPYRRFRVTAMMEKPERPKTQWAATAVYAFGTRLYRPSRRSARNTAPESSS